MQLPGDAGIYVAEFRGSAVRVLRIDPDAGTTGEACGLSAKSAPGLSVAPGGTIVGAIPPEISHQLLFRCEPVSHTVTFPDAAERPGERVEPVGRGRRRALRRERGRPAAGRGAAADPGRRRLPPLDSEVDGLPNAWETVYGLDPFDASGDDGAGGDPDDDGRTNAQELADGTHPRGLLSRSFAEGATGLFFRTRFDLANSSEGLPPIVLMRFLIDAGAVAPYDAVLDPSTRFNLYPSTLPGLANATFSTIIEADTGTSPSTGR